MLGGQPLRAWPSPLCPLLLQWLMQSPFIILVSICGGLLGTAFNLLRKKLW